MAGVAQMTAVQTSPTITSFAQTKQFGSLDGLRALAVLAVVWHHVGGGSYTGQEFLGSGYLGVELFFVVSGFLITTLLLRERERHGDISLKAFAMRRLLRIFPLYYTIILVYIAAVLLIENDPTAKSEFWDNLPAFLTYTTNWFVDLQTPDQRVIFYFAWSLAAEEQFYLVWPQLLKWLGNRLASGLVAVAAAAYFVLGLWVWEPSADLALPERMIRSVPLAILLGVVSAFVLANRRSFNIVSTVVGQRWSAPLWLGVVALTIANTHIEVEWVVLMFALLVMSCVIREDNGLAPVFKLKPLVKIGAVSYGVYLMHMLVVNLVDEVIERGEIDIATLPRFVIVAGLTIGAAMISFRYFESLFLRRKHAFAR